MLIWDYLQKKIGLFYKVELEDGGDELKCTVYYLPPEQIGNLHGRDRYKVFYFSSNKKDRFWIGLFHPLLSLLGIGIQWRLTGAHIDHKESEYCAVKKISL